MFIEPKLSDIKLSKKLGADCVEIHTGKYCKFMNNKKKAEIEYGKIKKSAAFAKKLSLLVHAGHGLTYKSAKIIAKIKNIKEFNIGHFIISEAIFIGLRKAILNFKKFLK